MPIPTPGLTLLAGSLHSGKTALVLDLAVCVALGKPWLGLPVPQAAVLYSDEEWGLRAFTPRIRSALIGHGADQHTPFHFTSFGFDYRHPYQLVQQAADLQAAFLVIDSLQPILLRSTSVIQTPLLSTLAGLQQLASSQRLAILAVVHASPRGLLRNAAALATVCDLVLSHQHSERHVQLRSLNTDLPPIAASFQQTGGGLRLHPIQPSPLNLPPLQIAILEHLQHHGSAPRKDLPGQRASLKKALRRLKASGLITHISSSATYILTPQGQAAVCQADTPPLSATRSNNFPPLTGKSLDQVAVPSHQWEGQGEGLMPLHSLTNSPTCSIICSNIEHPFNGGSKHG